METIDVDNDYPINKENIDSIGNKSNISKSAKYKSLLIKQEEISKKVLSEFNVLNTIIVSSEKLLFNSSNHIFSKEYLGEEKDIYLNFLFDDLQYLYDIDCDDVREHLGVLQKKYERIQFSNPFLNNK